MGSMQQLEYSLQTHIFKSGIQIFNSPEGYMLGWGTTVGGGFEGWAPNAIFIDTNAAQGAGVFTNTGTKTSATWTEIADAGVAGGFGMTGTQDISGAGKITMEDDVELILGTGDDIEVKWDGSKLISAPPTGLWAGAPSPLDPNPNVAVTLFDDFLAPALDDASGLWVEVDDGATGTNISGDIIGGSMKIVTAASDNDHHAIRSASQCFNLVGTKELWFEVRFRITEATTNESTWWFGVLDALTTGGMQANTAGPLATYDGILMWTQEGDLAILSETSNAGTQATNTTLGNYVSGTWTRLGFHVSSAATTAVVTFYSNLDDTAVMTAFGTTKNLTRSGLQEMHVVLGLKTGPSAAIETLEIDYVKCVQLR